MRGENICKAYLQERRGDGAAFRGGWFHTGDIGYRDADGFFYITDRKSDMIIRGGENIYPREIDELLYRHPAVAAAAVIGVPDELYGEDVAAFVVLKEGRELRPKRMATLLPRAPRGLQVPEDRPRRPRAPERPDGQGS